MTHLQLAWFSFRGNRSFNFSNSRVIINLYLNISPAENAKSSVTKDVGHDQHQWNFARAIFPTCYKKQSIRSFFTSHLIIVFISWDCQQSIYAIQGEVFCLSATASLTHFQCYIGLLHGWRCSLLLENSENTNVHCAFLWQKFWKQNLDRLWCLRYSHRQHVIAVYSERGGVRTKSSLSCSRSCRYVINDPVSMSFIFIFFNHILLSLWK